MKNKLTILLLVCAVFYIMKNCFGYSPLAVNILNDLLAMPIILILLQAIMHFLYGERFRMTYALALLSAGVIAVLFEGIFPMISPKATSDWMDVVFYFAGAFGYMLFIHIDKKRIITG